MPKQPTVCTRMEIAYSQSTNKVSKMKRMIEIDRYDGQNIYHAKLHNCGVLPGTLRIWT